jgi:RNA polymerase sigma-70 factor (ECF subfamily)
MSSDGELILRLQDEDLDALGELFERYRHQVYRVALAIVRDPFIAEDILQDAFLKLHKYAHRIDIERPLMPWLYRVTANLSYTFVTRNAKRRVPLDDINEGQLVSPKGQAPDKLTEKTELRKDVREAIETLSTQQRTVVILHYLATLSIQEIADILECPVGTVKSRLHHARNNLRQRLQSEQLFAELTHEYA